MVGLLLRRQDAEENFPAHRLTLARLDRIFLSRSTEQLAAFRF